MLKSDLCDAYTLVKRTTTVQNTKAVGQPANNNGVELVFKHCAPFTDYISEISNTQLDNA